MGTWFAPPRRSKAGTTQRSPGSPPKGGAFPMVGALASAMLAVSFSPGMARAQEAALPPQASPDALLQIRSELASLKAEAAALDRRGQLHA